MSAPAGDVVVRAARPGDYDAIAAVVDEWWGRPILGILPRLFLDHFHRTSLVAERDGVLGGFLLGVPLAVAAAEAYIHFVGVAPQLRGTRLAGDPYTRFFALAAAEGRTTVSAVTSPANTGSIAFHRRMGFTVTGPVENHDGPGHDLMTFRREL